MANNIFSSEFISSAGEQYKVDLFAESYEGFTADIIGGGSSVFFVAKDWTDFLTNGQPVLLDGVTADFINSFTYNEAQDRTQITLQTSTYSTQTTIENNAGHGSSYIPDFDPIIIDVHTEWEAGDDIILDSIKASNTVITYANKNAWFDRFMDLYLESNDNNLKLVIYKDNTGWELEWVGNIVVDLLEWDNAPKPIPITIKAIDGLDKLKDIPYDDVNGSDAERQLKDHIFDLLDKNDLSQFWGTLDPYIRESIEYKSNEVSGTLTNAHSPLDYAYLPDTIFQRKQEDELEEGISCYDALRGILELFNCRMFISKGVYYIQQVRNYEISPIAYRQYTKSVGTYSTGTYVHDLDANNDGTGDLNILAGGKFGYLHGLYRSTMQVKKHQQMLIYVEKNVIGVGNGTLFGANFENPQELSSSLGTVDGGVGSGAMAVLKWNVETGNRLQIGDYLRSSIMLYQGGTVGIHRPIDGGSGTQVSFKTTSNNYLQNFDMGARISSSSTIEFFDASGSSITTANIVSYIQTAGVLTITIDTSYSSSWVYAKTNDYTETYFLTGGDGNPLEWVTMEYANIHYSNRTYYTSVSPKFKKAYRIETPEVPFSGEMLYLAEFRHVGRNYVATGNKLMWSVYNVGTMFPVEGATKLNTMVRTENTTSNWTKELVLPPIIITDDSSSTSLNQIRVKEDYLTTNNTLVKAETWDANLTTIDRTLTITRVMEAMSLQYKPVERYMGGFVGQYYPHNTIHYEDQSLNVYYFHTFRKHYLMDEVDGEWFQQVTRLTNLTPTEYDGWEDSEDETTGGGLGDGLVGMIDNSLRGSLVDADSDAGTTTSLTIEANEIELKSGESIIVYDPTNGELTETLTLSSDLAVGATTANFTSQVTTKNIKSGMVFQPKKDTLFNRTKSLRDDLTTAESDISTLQSEMDVVQARQLFIVNNQTSNYTLQIGDEFTIIQCDSTSTIDVTIPTNASEPFELGTIIKILQYGLGSVKVAAAVGVTIRAADGYNTMAKQYGTATLTKMDGDEWLLEGEYLLSST